MSKTRSKALLLGCVLFATLAVAKQAVGDDNVESMLSQNCVRMGIDQCYRDGGERMIRMLLPQIKEGLSPADAADLPAINIRIVADRDVALMAAYVDDRGQRRIDFSSGALYYLQSVSYSATLGALYGLSEAVMDRYFKQLVADLSENGRRARLGQPLLQTKSLAQVAGISSSDEKQTMNTDKGRALTNHSFQTQFLWILSHEIGHHALKHVPTSTAKPPETIRGEERRADSYATRILLKLGYSVAPMISGMVYFAAAEKTLAIDVADMNHPVAECRLADILQTALNGYRRNPFDRDGLNRSVNQIVLMNPQTPAVIRNLRAAGNGCSD